MWSKRRSTDLSFSSHGDFVRRNDVYRIDGEQSGRLSGAADDGFHAGCDHGLVGPDDPDQSQSDGFVQDQDLAHCNIYAEDTNTNRKHFEEDGCIIFNKVDHAESCYLDANIDEYDEIEVRHSEPVIRIRSRGQSKGCKNG